MITTSPGLHPCLKLSKVDFYLPVLSQSAYSQPIAGQCLSCEEKLAQAEAAYHNLLTGYGVVEVHHDGRTLRYTKADAPSLQGYIFTLRNECGPDVIKTGCGGCQSKGRARGVSY